MPIQTRLHLLAFAAAVTAACGPAPDPLGPTPGRSNRPRGGPPVPAASATAKIPTVWERWQELGSYRIAIPRRPSQHLAADHEAETLANEVASAYPDLGPARVLPPGSVVVQRLFEPGAPSPVVLFAMVKREASEPAAGGAWELVVLDPSGLVSERGALEACARCHAEAPNDGVFGRAR